MLVECLFTTNPQRRHRGQGESLVPLYTRESVSLPKEVEEEEIQRWPSGRGGNDSTSVECLFATATLPKP